MNMSVNMSVDKQDPTKDDRDSEDSMESSPEGEIPPVTTTQQNQQPKRKGGRKPVSLSRPTTRCMCLISCNRHHWLRPTLTWTSDIRNVGGEEAEEPSGPGRLPGAANRVHQAARGSHPHARAAPRQSSGRSPPGSRRVLDAALQELAA